MLLNLLLALAAPAPPLTLEEVARLAADGAPAVRRADALFQAARARQSSARARLWPSLSAEAGALSSNDPVDAFALALKQERFSAASFFASDPNHPSSITDWNGALTASWSVDLFGSTRGEARAAQSAAAASDQEARRARDSAVLNAMEAFARAQAAEESLAILSKREADAERDASLAESLFEQGMTTSADPARARASLAETRAESASQQAARERARAALASLIGAEQASRPLAELPEPSAADEETHEKTREDVLAAELLAKAADAAALAARAARYPALSLQGRYEVHAPRPGARWGDSSSISAGLRIPLFTSGAVDARIAEMAASARAAGEAAEETRRSALEDAVSTHADVRAADAREESFAAAREAARQAREIQQARYEEGVGRLSDLLDARRAELSARLGAVLAREGRVVGRMRLRFALGLAPEGEKR